MSAIGIKQKSMENLDTDVIVERFNSMTILRLSCLLIDSGDKQIFFSFLNIGGFFTDVSFEFFKHYDNVLKVRVGAVLFTLGLRMTLDL